MLSYLNGTLSRSSVAGDVLQKLRRDIILQTYPPETKLTEKLLYDTYDISKGPARQILQQLENEGLVTMLENGCKKTIRFSEAEIYDLYTFRNLLETTAIRIIFEKKVKSYSVMLESFIKLENLSKCSDETYFEHDVDFHHSIIEMSGNKYLLRSYENIAPLLCTMFEISYEVSRDSFYEDDMETHNQLMKSILCDNLESCLNKFEIHINSMINAKKSIEAIKKMLA